MSASKHVARATTPRRLPKRPTTTRFDERLQCVIELAADFYWEQDANGRFTVYRPSSEPDAELDGLVGKTSAELFTVGPDDAGWAPHLTALEQRAAFRDVLHSLATAANGVRHFSLSGQPVFDQRNKFKGYRGIARDVSAHIRGERLTRLTVDGRSVMNVENLVQRMGRIRDVRQGADGFIYVAFESRSGEPTSVVRLEPVG